MADTPSSTTHQGTPSAPRDRLGSNYWKLFSASSISNLGDGIGAVAYPWLASAITRNPMLIALVAIAQRIPWLIFSLPAGVVTDRMDRRTLMVRANVARTAITIAVAFVILGREGDLPAVDALTDPDLAVDTDVVLFLLVVLATLLLGIAEVFYDNAAQTFMPSIVHADHLEKANGRLWSAEMVANTFAGPPLGGFLIAIAFSLPFFVDAGTFAVSAALIALVPAVRRSSSPASATTTGAWRGEIKEGVQWLWAHELLRPMAIILGMLNALGSLTLAIMVLFAQEILDTSATEFALLTTGGAVGGIIGGWSASAISKRIGTGPSLYVTLLSGVVVNGIIGVTSNWLVAWVMFAFFSLTGVLWNVITVSLRQSIIPDHLLGRVNSVYRFFAWGMMPIGTALGGFLVVIVDLTASREAALRFPWFAAGVLHLLLFAFAAPKLTTAKIEAARIEASGDHS